MATYSGRNATVRMGTTAVVGIGTWNFEGVTVDQIDTTAFGSIWKTFEAGMMDGGTISFEGYFDPSDSAGQAQLMTYNEDGTHIVGGGVATGLRFYYSTGGYYEAATSNPVSYILMTSYSVKADKADVARITFSAKISGKMNKVGS
jgi:hypothetical protein